MTGGNKRKKWLRRAYRRIKQLRNKNKQYDYEPFDIYIKKKRLRLYGYLCLLIIFGAIILPVFTDLGERRDPEKYITVEFDYMLSDDLNGLPITDLFFEIYAQDGTTLLYSGYTGEFGLARYYMGDLDWIFIEITYNGVLDHSRYNVSDYKFFGLRAPQFTGQVYTLDGDLLPEGVDIDLLVWNAGTSTWDTWYTFTTGTDGTYSIFVPQNKEWSILPSNITVITDQFTTPLLTTDFDLFVDSKGNTIRIVYIWTLSEGYAFVFLIMCISFSLSSISIF